MGFSLRNRLREWPDMGGNIRVSTATGWITRTIGPVSAYRCVKVSRRHWSFNLVSWVTRCCDKGSTYRNFLARGKHISQTLTLILLASPSLPFFLPLFYSSPVSYIGCGRMPRVAKVALLEQELYEIDGDGSGASQLWLEASSFHLSRSICTTSLLSPSFTFIFLTTTQLVSPFLHPSITHDYCITGSEDQRIQRP